MYNVCSTYNFHHFHLLQHLLVKKNLRAFCGYPFGKVSVHDYYNYTMDSH